MNQVQFRCLGTCLLLVTCGVVTGCGKSEGDSKPFGEAGATDATGGSGASVAGATAIAGRDGASAGAGSQSEAGAGGAPEPSGTGGGSSGAGSSGAGSSGTGQSEPAVSLNNTGEATSGAVLADLEVTHSHFYVDPAAKLPNTWTWLAVIKNNRKDLACDLSVEGTFLAAGSAPIKIFAEVAASPYRLANASSVFRCIAPGEVGVASGLAVDGVPTVAPGAVSELRYAIVGTLGPDYVPGNWVALSGVEVADSSGGRVVSGMLTNGTSTMPWWEADVFPANGKGLPLTQFVLKDTRTQLAPGATWEFQTAPYDGAIEQAYVFVRHARAK